MTTGLMASDANYPSNSGVPLGGTSMLNTFTYPRKLAVMTIEGTPGGSASYKMQTLLRDTDNASGTWQDAPNGALSGHGAAATGQIILPVIGESVRIVAANGSSPGTGANTPRYTLNVYETYNDIPEILPR